jgi:hypothetical protein
LFDSIQQLASFTGMKILAAVFTDMVATDIVSAAMLG